MPRIVRVMQGFDMDNTNAKYDLGVNSAFKIVDSVSKDTKRTNPQIIVIAENNKALISYSVSQGVYGISVTPKDVKEVRKLVSSEEAKLILSSK
jgi:hypothetical protein